MNRILISLPIFILLFACTRSSGVRVADVGQPPAFPSEIRVAYGPDASVQFGDLRLPEGEGPHPVIVLIHGGCWLSGYDLHLMDAMAVAFTGAGYATWNIEYRRVGDEDGGWPNTFRDVAGAVDYLAQLADQYPLDLFNVIAMGHSAGGHLALWLGARDQLPADSQIYSSQPLSLDGIVSLAGITDLERYLVREEGSCGSAVDELMGGLPEAQPLRYQHASPIRLLPLGTPHILVSGAQDPIVTLEHVEAYFQAAKQAGDEVQLFTGDEAGHFEVITPGSNIWGKVEAAVTELLEK